MDLDTGAVQESCRDPAAEASGWDILVAYHADRQLRSVLFQNPSRQVQIAHLPGRSFEEVTAADIEGAPFTEGAVDEPFDDARVILIRTDLGAVFKLGNPLEADDGLTFDYALLSPPS